MAQIMVIDDEQMICLAFEAFLKDEGHVPLRAGSAEAALDVVQREKPEIIFLDYRLPRQSGLDILTALKEISPASAIVFMTAFGTMDVVIKAMQLGAYEYLTKPLDLSKVRELINRILSGRKALAEIPERARTAKAVLPSGQIIGTSPAIQEIFKMIGILSTQQVTVLITGESGVGKELVARAIHDHSPSRHEPFVAINCGALPENLLESEMFGHEKGAFTGATAMKPGKFEVAAEGTVFLDEISEMRPELQVKLLRVLQEKTFTRVGGNTTIFSKARIIAATNTDLYQEMVAGRFRKDLFYRLHLVHLNIPPLRTRKEDIALLADHFILKAGAEMGKTVRGIAAGVGDKFMDYSWPGNVRELENMIRRALVLSRGEVLGDDLFEFKPDIAPASPDAWESLFVRAAQHFFAATPLPEGESLMEKVSGIVEKTLIKEALARTGNNQVQAAQLLGMHRSTFRKKMQEYGL